MGGGGDGVGLVHDQAGVRYTRIPDPAHVLSARGWARGKERKTDNHRRRSPIKNVCSRPINFFLRADMVGPSVRKSNKRFVHSFIHSIFPEKEYRGLSPSFHIHASVSDLYIPTIGLPILL